MKLICINNQIDRHYSPQPHPIIGEVYEGEIYDKELSNYYWIIYKLDSKGLNEGWAYPKDIFITLSEWREQQILSVINEEDN